MSHPSTDRRTFLRTSLGVAASAAMVLPEKNVVAAPVSTQGRSAGLGWIDTHVWLGPWLLRHLDPETPDELARHLRRRGITEAWTGTFDGLLHKNLAEANARLADACRRHGRGILRPFGTVHPAFPDWEEELRRCHEVHRMPGIRLHPNYHGYALDDPRFRKLLRLAAGMGLVVQLAVVMEDDRMMHPLLRVPMPDLAPLPAAIADAPSSLRFMLLGALKAVHPVLIRKLADTGRVRFEISALEGVAGLEGLLGRIPLESVVFGSHAPFLYFEAAALKLKESELRPDQDRAVRYGNARRLLPSA